MSAAAPAMTRTSVSAVTGRIGLPPPRSFPRPTGSATAIPAIPAASATAPITMAFAARTRPRRGDAARVRRMRPRRYSAVMNRTPRTATAISAANEPTLMASSIRMPPPTERPGTTGAMSPLPLTVNPAPARRNPSSPEGPDVSPTSPPVHTPPCQVPPRLR